jgi:hypothetical protein
MPAWIENGVAVIKLRKEKVFMEFVPPSEKI